MVIVEEIIEDDDDAQRSKSAQQLKEQGNECFKCGEIEKAVDHFTEAIKLEPENYLLYSNRCLGLMKLRKLEDALADADKAIALEPTFGKVHFRRATILLDLGRLEEASEAVQQTLKCGVDIENCSNLLRQINAQLNERSDILVKPASSQEEEERRSNPEKSSHTKEDNHPKPVKKEIKIDEETAAMLVKSVDETLQELKKEEEEDEMFKVMRNDWEKGEKRLKEVRGRTLEHRACGNSVSVSEQAKMSLNAEEIRQKQDAAKFRALAQHMDYEGFRQLVAGATLKPMAKTESVWNMADDKTAPMNKAFQDMNLANGGQHENTKANAGENPTQAAVEAFNAKQFSLQWQRNTVGRFEQLLSLQIENLKTLFPIEVDPLMMGQLLVAAKVGLENEKDDQRFKGEAQHILSLLTAIEQRPRFDLALMFLEKVEKEAGKSMFDLLSPHNGDATSIIRKKYKM